VHEGGEHAFATKSRTMEQDDKVFTAALSVGSTMGFGPSSVRTFRAGGSVERQAVDGVDAADGRALGAVVGSASAMEPQTPQGPRQGATRQGASPDVSETDSAEPTVPSDPGDDAGEASKANPGGAKTPKKSNNNVRKIRIERMMSKAELARRANLSVLTIDRVERGYGCRVDTKRKILEALGLSLADRVRVFGEEE